MLTASSLLDHNNKTNITTMILTRLPSTLLLLLATALAHDVPAPEQVPLVAPKTPSQPHKIAIIGNAIDSSA